MKLDRNILSNDGRGKYALVKLRGLAERQSGPINRALQTLDEAGLIEWGEPGTVGEFFVLKLRDEFAAAALKSYAINAASHDREYAEEVMVLANRAGKASPFHKRPD